mgnify:FL=1
MLLLVFDYIPSYASYYVIPSDHPQAENARKSNGLMINGDDLDGDHPIFTLDDWLDTDEARAMRVETPYKGNITEVYSCGTFL